MVKIFCGVVALMVLYSQGIYASCCSQASSGGIGRLSPHERALVQLSSAARLSYGSFDQQANFTFGNPHHLPYLALDQEVHAMVRLFRHLEPFAKVVARLQKSSRDFGANVANSLVGTRIPLPSTFRWLPAISVLASWEIPSGVVSGQNHEYRPEFITSMGVHMLNLGLFLEKTFDPFSLVLGYGFSCESPFSKNEVVQGQIHSPSISMNFPLDDTNFLAANLAATFVGPLHLGEEKIANSAKRKIALSMSYAKKIHSHMTLLATMGSDVPVDYLGTNLKSEAFVNLGMRFGVF